MPDVLLSDVTVLNIENPASDIEVITVQIPGISGPQGPQGAAGLPNILTVGTVTTGAPTDPAAVTLSGASPNQVISFVLPQGQQGPQGDTGPAPNLTIGTVTTGAAGSSASASIAGTTPDYTLNFTIPQGANGGGIVVGGLAGDILMKNSATDFDTKWSTPTAASTPSTLMERDAAGRASVADPSVSTDISTKNYVDTRTWPATSISDSTATGRSVLTAADAATARTAIGAGTSNLAIGTTSTTAKAGDYQPASANISDSTTVGRSVLTAADAAAARTAIGAGTSSLAIGTTSTTAKAGDYQPTAANISDSTVVGRSVLTAADAATARTAIGAGTSSLAIGTTNTTAKAGDYQPTSANISDATSAATANVVLKRDASGRASVADPSASTDIATKNYTDTQDNAYRRWSIGSQTGTTYTLALTDEGKLNQFSNAAAVTVTVPPNSSVAFPVGTRLRLEATGAVGLTVAAGAGVTINNAGSLVLKQYQTIELVKSATDTWETFSSGNLAGSGGVLKVQQITQAAYTALGTPDANTLYVIVG